MSQIINSYISISIVLENIYIKWDEICTEIQ
jgi:hypothetical protein